MSRRVPFVAIVAGLALGAGAATARASEGAARPSKPPSVIDLARAVPAKGHSGGWAEYAHVQNGKIDFTSTIRMVVIETEHERTVEVWFDKMGRNALRIQQGLEDDRIATAFMKVPQGIFTVDMEDEEPAVPICGAPGSDCQPVTEEEKRTTPVPKQETVKTPAGTFKALRQYRKVGEDRHDYWFSEQVPALTLVRLRTSTGAGLELVATGTDAASAFPARFEAKPFPYRNIQKIADAIGGAANRSSRASQTQSASTSDGSNPAASSESSQQSP